MLKTTVHVGVTNPLPSATALAGHKHPANMRGVTQNQSKRKGKTFLLAAKIVWPLGELARVFLL